MRITVYLTSYLLDCRGDEYKQHTKCISEEEKYSGKDYKPKPGANKGEAKQEKWTDVSNSVDVQILPQHCKPINIGILDSRQTFEFCLI